jgi:long-chain acyl-CoA synthetase
VRESAVVAARQGTSEQVHAVLVIDSGVEADAVVNQANGKLEPHQRIRGVSVWPQASLPRTPGTSKLKRTEVAAWVAGAAPTPQSASSTDSVESIIQKYAGSRHITAGSSLDDLGLSSLDRIQLLMELEQRTGTRIDEAQFGSARTVADLARIQPASAAPVEAFEFPVWNRSLPARFLRRVALPGLILPLTRLFAWIQVSGLDNLRGVNGPVIFASNHQSHFDAPAILYALPARWRYRVAPAMAKEFFEAHFHPDRYPWTQRFTSGLNYFLAALVFNAFPLPQREAGAREALRYAGELASDGYSVLIFPEGKRTDQGEILPFQPGAGMLASRLRLPVIPVRLEGLERVLHKTWRMPVPGRARVKFGDPLNLEGDDYAGLAKRIEEAVRAL